MFRLSANEDWEGVMACGVEPAELSESESNEVARLCMLRDCVSLEFIRASLVTWKYSHFDSLKMDHLVHTVTESVVLREK